MSQSNHHHDWLSLVEISGPFLAVPVLKEAFPQGLEELDAAKRKRLRQAYERPLHNRLIMPYNYSY